MLTIHTTWEQTLHSCVILYLPYTRWLYVAVPTPHTHRSPPLRRARVSTDLHTLQPGIHVQDACANDLQRAVPYWEHLTIMCNAIYIYPLHSISAHLMSEPSDADQLGRRERGERQRTCIHTYIHKPTPPPSPWIPSSALIVATSARPKDGKRHIHTRRTTIPSAGRDSRWGRRCLASKVMERTDTPRDFVPRPRHPTRLRITGSKMIVNFKYFIMHL